MRINLHEQFDAEIRFCHVYGNNVVKELALFLQMYALVLLPYAKTK